MQTVINKLGLAENADENAVLNAIQNKESEMDAMKAELEKKKAECDELEKKYAELCDKMEKDAKAKAEDEAKAKAKAEEELEEECKAMVNNFAKAGRIKNDAEVIEKWVKTAKVQGVAETKAMIEALPLNKPAANIPVNQSAPSDPNAQPMSAVRLMAEVLNKTKRK